MNIYKYTLQKPLAIPKEHKLLKFGHDSSNQLCVWMEVNPHTEIIEFDFQLMGTGDLVPNYYKYKYFDSAIGQLFVWHLYVPITF